MQQEQDARNKNAERPQPTPHYFRPLRDALSRFEGFPSMKSGSFAM
jgi:hypothetical protein